MTVLGQIKIKNFLENTEGEVRGKLITDAKFRIYYTDYIWEDIDSEHIRVSRKDGTGNDVRVNSTIDLDESLISFFGLYSGDGAKGTEYKNEPGRLKPVISFSQREPNLVRFAVEQFRRLFPGAIHFVFSLGEDSALFMDERGLETLKNYYGGKLPKTPPLDKVRPKLNSADERYLQEQRPTPGSNEEHLAFYYFHKNAMEDILTEIKRLDIERSGVELGPNDRVTASLRRPFKKGAREPGGSSRSDEIHVGGLNGIGELFLKILHEIEDSIVDDSEVSTQGLIQWNKKPSEEGELIDVKEFFETHNYGQLGEDRSTIEDNGIYLKGIWPRSKPVKLQKTIRIDPLWCYTSGLYLAEGSTPKSTFFSMFKTKPSKLAIGFTSSEDNSLFLMLKTLQKLFPTDSCLRAWKVKVGSQYFPELVVIGLKNGVPMLRGGKSGDGKLRTMEISLAVKDWALQVAPSLIPYSDKYSHVEPTGAGVPRIDFWASSSLCRWYFPLIQYATFGQSVKDPKEGFGND